MYVDAGGLSPPEAGSPDGGETLSADGCSRPGDGSLTRARRGVTTAAQTPIQPRQPASVDTATAPAASRSLPR